MVTGLINVKTSSLYPANIYLLKVTIETLGKGVENVQGYSKVFPSEK